MSRPGYVNYRVGEGSPREAMLRKLCRLLGLPETHRGYVAAIDAALAIALREKEGDDG
jgi:hypothetical protein